MFSHSFVCPFFHVFFLREGAHYDHILQVLRHIDPEFAIRLLDLFVELLHFLLEKHRHGSHQEPRRNDHICQDRTQDQHINQRADELDNHTDQIRNDLGHVLRDHRRIGSQAVHPLPGMGTRNIGIVIPQKGVEHPGFEGILYGALRKDTKRPVHRAEDQLDHHDGHKKNGRRYKRISVIFRSTVDHAAKDRRLKSGEQGKGTLDQCQPEYIPFLFARYLPQVLDRRFILLCFSHLLCGSSIILPALRFREACQLPYLRRFR